MSCKEVFYLYFDGGSRGNPGKSGCGSVLYDSEMNEIDYTYSYLGQATNNQAEYTGLIEGIKLVRENKIDISQVIVRGDSNLVIQQCLGKWKVKHPNIIPLHSQVKGFKFKSMEQVPRELNKRADELANLAMNSEKSLS